MNCYRTIQTFETARPQRLTRVRSISIAVLTLFAALIFGVNAFAAGYKDAEREIKHGEYEHAVDIYRKLLEKDRRDMKARLGVTYALLKLGRFDLAYQQASQAVMIDPLNARAHALFGTALLRSGNFQVSIEEFKTALQFDPREAMAVAGLAEVDFYENRRRESYEKIKLATELDPSEPDYFYQLGHAASRIESYNEAANAYQNFLTIAPLKDQERRDRIRGLVQFFRYIGTTKLMRPNGPDKAVIPFNMVKYRPYIDVSINGQAPMKFVIDTGASLPVISNETAKKLGLRPIARGGFARAVGGTGSFEIVYGFLDNVTIGGIRIDAVPVFFRSLLTSNDEDPKLKPAGYIGLSLLAGFLTTIDYSTQSMTLERNGVLPPLPDTTATTTATTDVPTQAFDIPLRSTNNGLISAETRVDGNDPVSFIVDTGATTSALSKSIFDLFPAKQKKVAKNKITIIGAAGITENVDVLPGTELAISNLSQKNLNIPILDFSPINETSGFEQSGIIGGDFLFRFQLILDMGTMRLRLKPQSPAVEVRPASSVQESKP